jgi:hypothetical protein
MKRLTNLHIDTYLCIMYIHIDNHLYEVNYDIR